MSGATWIDIKIRGLGRLSKRLAELPVKVQKRVLPKVVRAGANMVRDEARRLVVRRSGALAKTIKVRRVKTGSSLNVVMAVGTNARIGHLIEFGTAPHVIKPKRKKAVSYGPEQIYGAVKHPGTPAQPFLRPAFDRKVRHVTWRMRAKLQEEIEREARAL